MNASLLFIIGFILILLSALVVFVKCNSVKNGSGKLNFKEANYYCINSGNQTELYFAPDYNQQWLDTLTTRYSWDNFDEYDNRYFEYMYGLFDTLPVLAEGKTKSDIEFFDKLTRGQKVFYALLVFGGDTNNGGVDQFFSNRPEFAFAVLEALRELRLQKLASDYERCLDSYIGVVGSYSKRETLSEDPGFDWAAREEEFSKRDSEIPEGDEIEEYFYSKQFRVSYYKTVVDYIDQHLDQFVRR